MANLLNQHEKPAAYYYSDRSEMLQYVPEHAQRILEIGCGAGEFGESLKKYRNIEFWGVDICQEMAEHAKAKLDNVIVGNIESENLSLPGGYFDCIVFNDVIEHLVNPWIVLNNMRQLLNNTGCVIASIPNIRYFDTIRDLIKNKNWQYQDYGILDKTHLRFFTINSIRSLFEVSNFTVVNIQGIKARKFPWKFNIFNLLMNRTFDDMKYLQFACVAIPNKDKNNDN